MIKHGCLETKTLLNLAASLFLIVLVLRYRFYFSFSRHGKCSHMLQSLLSNLRASSFRDFGFCLVSPYYSVVPVHEQMLCSTFVYPPCNAACKLKLSRSQNKRPKRPSYYDPLSWQAQGFRQIYRFYYSVTIQHGMCHDNLGQKGAWKIERKRSNAQRRPALA